MNDILVKYLFLKKNCPLPGFGSLQIIEGISSFQVEEKKIFPPAPFIQYTETVTPSDELNEFISWKKNIPLPEAENLLKEFSENLKNLKEGNEIELPFAGKFYVDVNGNLLFKSLSIPAEYFPVIPAEPVVNVIYNPRVAMHTIEPEQKVAPVSEVAVPEAPVVKTPIDESPEPETAVDPPATVAVIEPKKQRWWIAAVLLTLIGIAAILFYLKEYKQNSYFGNSQKVKAGVEGKTYQKIP